MSDYEDAADSDMTEKRVEESEKEPPVDLHGLNSWEPRNAFDRFCVWFEGGSSTAVYAGFAFAVLLLAGVLGAAAYGRPVVAVFALVSVVPAFFLAWYIWEENPYEAPALDMVTVSFLLGCLLVTVPLFVNTVSVGFFEAIPIGMALFFLFVVAPLEETVKWLAVRLHGYEQERFDSAVDGAVLGAVAGLGFATMENAVYVAGGIFVGAGGLNDVFLAVSAQERGMMRAAISPLHVLWTAIAGYYLGLAKLNKRHEGAVVFKGLLIAFALHGAYNVAVTYTDAIAPVVGFEEGTVFLVFAVGFYGVSTYYLARLVGGHRRLTEFREKTTEVRSIMSMSDEEVNELMRRSGAGVVALADENDAYAVPMSFGYDADEGAVYMMMAFAPESKKRRWIRNTETASFVVYEFDGDDEARSVVVTGRIEEVSDDAERGYAALTDNADFTVMHESGTLPEDADYSVHRLKADELSGRRFEEEVWEKMRNLDGRWTDG